MDIGKEELIWYEVLHTLFDMKQDPMISRKKFCRDFFEKRVNMFMGQLVINIPFKNFVESFASERKEFTYADLKGVLAEIFQDFRSEKIIIRDVKKSIFALDTDTFKNFNMSSGQGILFRRLRCMLCKSFIDGSPDDYQSK